LKAYGLGWKLELGLGRSKIQICCIIKLVIVEIMNHLTTWKWNFNLGLKQFEVDLKRSKIQIWHTKELLYLGIMSAHQTEIQMTRMFGKLATHCSMYGMQWSF
jgi:hypothetical protein